MMQTSSGRPVDTDTLMNGTTGPFDTWESDHTALVHVLWDAKSIGLFLDNAEQTDTLASMINRSRWSAAARAAGPLARKVTVLPGMPVDGDTRDKGVEGPYADWESDHTALVHVLWSAQFKGWTLDADADKIAGLIERSRWMAAARAAGPLPR